MPEFARSFPFAALSDWDAKQPTNAVRALFDRWCLPGRQLSAERQLRVSIRNTYLNFYVEGQSVARLDWTQRGPKLSVHNAYVTGQRRDRSAPVVLPAKGYSQFGSHELGSADTAKLIDGWVTTARTYASAEKCFVDDLVAANPGVIDLEMGLPASQSSSSEKVAPRMDIVVAQREATEPLSIAFWEAKCANNPELRIRGKDALPRVLTKQIPQYETWMAGEGRVQEVQAAYRNAAKTLLALYRTFHGHADDYACVGLWTELGQLDHPVIVTRPGVVIGNYWPEGHMEMVARSRMEQAAKSFAEHRKKFGAAKVKVHEVGPGYESPVLPYLTAVVQG